MLSFVNVAIAEEKASTFSITPFIGGVVFDDDQDLDNAPAFGLRLGYNMTKYLGVEASGEYISTDYKNNKSSDVGNYRLDAILNLMPDSKLVPFIFGGFGAQSINYPKRVSNRNASAADYGGGLKYSVTDNIGLRVDGRQIYIFDDARKDVVYTLGLTYTFGGEKPAPAPAPAAYYEPKPVPAPIAQEPKVIVLSFEDINFDFDKSTLKPEAKTILKRNIQLLKENPKTQVRIAGYTSASGTDEYNQKLSERRANSIKTFLINEGLITPDRLSIIGYGETKPEMDESTPSDINSKAAKANMRALFEIIVKSLRVRAVNSKR